MEKTYLAIDLKSFYASVECIERGLDPLTANLVVADESRTEKTICLAVSPSLKAYGIPGRPRLFEVVRKIKEVNALRKTRAPGQEFTGSSWDDTELKQDPSLELDYVVAPPRMALYMKYSARIYEIYLKYIAPEDIHVYSIDEVMMDVTGYLNTYQMTGKELASEIIREVQKVMRITAAAGVGTNLYLCKVTMDIEAKHTAPDENGVRVAELDEMSYRRALWSHRPLTDFWRIGRGYQKKLEEHGLFTMGDIARCSLGKDTDYYNEDLLYRLFGVNAELLIDHAWGWEPCTIADIKAFKPASTSVGAGQVLACAYSFERARIVVREMADMLALDLTDRGLLTDQLVLTVGYDRNNLKDPKKSYRGEITADRYGRAVPKHAHGTENLERYTASAKKIVKAATDLYDRIVDHELSVRRLYLTASRVADESAAEEKDRFEQMDLFTDYKALEAEKERENRELEKEKKWQKAVLDIKKKYGKNAILKGMSLEEGATAIERNNQIGGHKA
ncbi:DNA methylase [Ruminococcus sp. CLA-AA-H200]|uniref:DNA methylase n=1 Tax=Ruminococcus turbiniformis TaxID=2881258 RepID=A0ABS8FXD7_9FIRM|nr:DNA methylase [Ruminococcus turbiniformis]MCC2253822.1 DNA methylase [Ruminococcus turbiniformis]